MSDLQHRDPAPPLRRMTRPRRDRVAAGVAAGLAEHLDVPASRVRAVFLATTLIGLGPLVYLLLWVWTPLAPAGTAPDGATAEQPIPRLRRVSLAVLVVGVAFLAVAWMVAVGTRNEWINVGTVLPVLAVGGGVVLAWSQLDEADTGLGTPTLSRTPAAVRLGVGAVLAVAGIIGVAVRGQGLKLVWDVLIAALAVLVGVALILAPWGVRFWHRFQQEQARAIREAQRADIAAHLHDSVLQTLALIQRTEDPARVTQLARAQERELRNWLYGKDPDQQGTLAAAVAAVTAEVEDVHGVPIDVVITGDAPYQESAEALVSALREALLNAVRHGAPPVSAYVEAGAGRIEAFVRDRGPGFDLDEVPADRLGVRESILGRMARRGGVARVRRMDPGTEVSLSVPVEYAAPPEAPDEPEADAAVPTATEPDSGEQPRTTLTRGS